ncbi:hypothetical protein CLOSYM_03446 [[Clostridium] symbiosum ATCC 14940]|uniref:Uncharacterized protein n=1 Tax=[Clostridium] symbiosum ATCC 14940 TaxID=411472 RepID=A0ABC9TUJ9_CLOSY|nr:hypothetical protein CLOSYM_03446 [[Clostridium] symbiosum ATCC 14940]
MGTFIEGLSYSYKIREELSLRVTAKDAVHIRYRQPAILPLSGP